MRRAARSAAHAVTVAAIALWTCAVSPARAEPASPSAEIASYLASRDLRIPVAGVQRDALRDTFADGRGTRSHEAMDVMAPRGTHVLAVDDGRIAKLFTSVPGGLTVYQFDPQERVAYYYAHLDAYAEGLREGAMVKRGDVLGYVGTTGNARPDAPHLHFAILVLPPGRQWWKGVAINPYPFYLPGR